MAQFVGTVNTLKAQVRSAQEGRLTIDDQEIQVSQGAEGLRDGDLISVSLRPERVSLYGENRKPNVLDVTVQTITFLGSIVRMQVQSGSNAFFMDEFNNPFLELPKIGDRIKVTFSKEAPLILKKTAAA